MAQDGPETAFMATALLLPLAQPRCEPRAPQGTWSCSAGGAGRQGLRGAAVLNHQAWAAAVVLSLDKQLSSAGQWDGVADPQFLLLGLLPSQGHLEAEGSGSSSSRL